LTNFNKILTVKTRNDQHTHTQNKIYTISPELSCRTAW